MAMVSKYASEKDFNSRKHVPLKCRDEISEPCVNKTNAYVYVLQELTFEEYFKKLSYKDILKNHVLARLPHCMKQKFITGPECVTDEKMTQGVIDELDKLDKDVTLYELCSTSRHKLPKDLMSAIDKRADAGIDTPKLDRTERQANKTKTILDNFLVHAGHLTLRDLYEKAKNEVSVDTVVAVRDARLDGLIHSGCIKGAIYFYGRCIRTGNPGDVCCTSTSGDEPSIISSSSP